MTYNAAGNYYDHLSWRNKMKRRGFLVSPLAASGLASAATSIEAASAGPLPAEGEREYYELRRYSMRRGPQQQRFDDYFRDAAIPGLNRLGIKPVGVFTTTIGPGSPALYTLTPHPSVESAITIHDRVSADPVYLQAGNAYINATANDPPYTRVEGFLLGAFAGMPKLEPPPGAAEHKPRIFELRTYESHSKKANRTKIGMFNKAEIALFRRAGMRPVFFGETLVGSGMPCLTYMLAFADMDERARQWAAFAGDPEWKKLSSTPGYTDPEIVSNITNVILSPTSYSQI
jgi:hypothetical protein